VTRIITTKSRQRPNNNIRSDFTDEQHHLHQQELNTFLRNVDTNQYQSRPIRANIPSKSRASNSDFEHDSTPKADQGQNFSQLFELRPPSEKLQSHKSISIPVPGSYSQNGSRPGETGYSSSSDSNEGIFYDNYNAYQ
jgi:hypothetical protein